MKTNFWRSSASALVISLAVGVAGIAHAADEVAAVEEAAADAPDGEIKTAEQIVVQGQIGYRNRSEEAEPVLVYDTDYFQRFEPLTAGDALKRVPSVTFLSDVIESDGARLRGLAPGYTQILINGDKVPGSNADRSFFMDRIPAELISRVEIVRSSSARRTGDAMAGTLNIVLRDGYELDGGYIRVGGLHFDDGKIKPSLGAVYGGEVGPGRLLVGLNLQGRHNPKIKQSFRYSDSPENDPNFVTTSFDNREDQTDTRDGTDYSANATYQIESDNTEFELSGFYVRTDRTETERSFEYNHPTNINGAIRAPSNGNLTVDNANRVKIDQENFSLAAKLSHEWAAGKTSVKLGYAKFIDERVETEFELEFDRSAPRYTGDLTLSNLIDKELSAKLEHEFKLSEDMDFVIGGLIQRKDRDTNIRGVPRTIATRFNVVDARGWNQFQQDPSNIPVTFGPAIAEANSGNLNTIREDRKDAFALIEGSNGGLTWEAGVRYEHNSFDINDATVAPANALQTRDYGLWLPSASVKFDVSSTDRLTASVARTNRRPDFNFIAPSRLLAELGDNDLLGNPQLSPETAWGVDVGYERRLGKSGVAGINFFYRDVSDLIELANTGVTGSEGAGTFVFQPRNTGDGKVYGIEFDLSTDLGFLGLPDTGIFGNFSWLDSEITDVFGKRRFNGQSEYVYNFGFIQDLRSVAAAFGATYRKQGDAFDRVIGEEVTTSYGGDLEIFVEKRIGSKFTIRAVGSNLLNGAKAEIFNKFTTQADQINRDFDEYELESETAGPVFQIIARYAF